MKKKIYKYVSVAVIAVAMVVSFQMSRANSATNLTMENVEALAMADGEGGIGGYCFWNPLEGECDTGGTNVCYGVHDC